MPLPLGVWCFGLLLLFAGGGGGIGGEEDPRMIGSVFMSRRCGNCRLYC